jgi:hypothetical protein
MWVRNNKGNVFVGNLPPDFPDERLAEAFDPFGIVLSAVVARDPATGARLRYGFVDIATERAASNAISALDGSEIDGCKLNVKARDKVPKKPGGRPAMRGPAARRPAREAGEPPPHRPATPADDPSPAADGKPAAGKLSQSQLARAASEAVEPPPRRDFEVVRRPLRRKEPSFQVERRPLPRRV